MTDKLQVFFSHEIVDTKEDGDKKVEIVKEGFEFKEGMTVLDLARMHDINIEGACEGSLVCSTCHVIVCDDWYNKLCSEQPISDSENDMIDLAYDPQPTSRLGCQIILKKQHNGMHFKLPKGTRNLKVRT